MKAVVVMSGGQDSTTCLGVAIKEHGANNILCVTFDYGQSHKVEVHQAQIICEKLDVKCQVVTVPILKQMKSSALVNGGDVTADHEYLKDRPASFVPARNALFLTMAYGLAMEVGATEIYTGVCETDYSGYPDCREAFIRTLNIALDKGYETCIFIRTPLMFLNKAQTFQLAEDLGLMETIILDTHTCYNGNHHDLHQWGYGCDDCPACELRHKGFDKFIDGDFDDLPKH